MTTDSAVIDLMTAAYRMHGIEINDDQVYTLRPKTLIGSDDDCDRGADSGSDLEG